MALHARLPLRLWRVPYMCPETCVALRARLPLRFALAVCFLNLSVSACGVERTVAYAFAVFF